MLTLPKIISTSVVRSAHQGESHGGIYLVDLETGATCRKVDWNTCAIDWEGRGGDRGLRGITFHNNEIYIAASDEIIIYDTGFKRIRSLRNSYLRHCHEITVHRDKLYISSTGYDSVLVYDISANCFVKGYCARLSGNRGFSVTAFDPNSADGPAFGDSLHLNSVFVDHEGLHIAGHQLPFIILIDAAGIYRYGKLPAGTHNARPCNGGLLFNHTAANSIYMTRRDSTLIKSYPIHIYDEQELENSALPNDHARQGFGRGLCIINDGEIIAAGSSPSTISVYSMKTGKTIKRINLTMDVRHAIHGLEVWPHP